MLEQEDFDPPDPQLAALRWVVVVLLAIGLGACIAKGANNPPDPKLLESRIPGFGEIAFQIVKSGGQPATPTQLCALLAATDQQRQRGLMQITDLHGYPGMVFRFATDSQGGFHMQNTPMPLSIAFFSADGSFVSAADMAPCEDRPGCPVTGASGPYRYALEVPQGKLGELGIGPGSILLLTGRCPSS
jgi:uncharacterized membrane protein (UPF0127 family)